MTPIVFEDQNKANARKDAVAYRQAADNNVAADMPSWPAGDIETLDAGYRARFSQDLINTLSYRKQMDGARLRVGLKP